MQAWDFILKLTIMMDGLSLGKFMSRLNAGIRNRQNFSPWVILSFQKIRTDSVNCADSGDTKILVQFPENSILEFSTNFWKCVGGADMRGRIPTRIYENA